jgi:ribosomal protein S18 acetylase RimI-like enzyme
VGVKEYWKIFAKGIKRLALTLDDLRKSTNYLAKISQSMWMNSFSPMIKKLANEDLNVARQIREVFQKSYAVEAEILGAKDFPPLKRPLEGYLNAMTLLYGYYVEDRLAAVTEINETDKWVHIQSLVVHPDYFRRGIGRRLVEFVFQEFKSDLYMVETGAKNEPACALYRTMGFQEVRQWDMDIGIRKVRFEKRF